MAIRVLFIKQHAGVSLKMARENGAGKWRGKKDQADSTKAAGDGICMQHFAYKSHSKQLTQIVRRDSCSYIFLVGREGLAMARRAVDRSQVGRCALDGAALSHFAYLASRRKILPHFSTGPLYLSFVSKMKDMSTMTTNNINQILPNFIS